MIAIELRTALTLYAGILGVLIVVIWIYTEIAVRRPMRYLGKQYLWRCVICGYSYLDEADEKLSECPRCGSINSVEDKHARFAPVAKRHEPEPEPQTIPDDAENRRNPSRRKRPNQRRRGPRRR